MEKTKREYRGYLTEYQPDILEIISSTLDSNEDKERFWKYRREWDQAESCDVNYPFPINLDFELVDACNLACHHCIRRSTDYRVSGKGSKRLGLQVYKRLIDEGAEYGLPAISLGNSGEGFLENDIFEMIDYARQKKVLDIWLSTNGLLLDKEKIKELIRLKLTRISISIDATTEETYKKVRGGDFGKLMSNLHYLIEERDRQKSLLPIIRVTSIKLEHNKDELDEFVSYWSSKVETVGLQEYLELRQKRNLTADQVKPFQCSSPWKKLMIWANGDVCPCCTFAGKDLYVGNIHESSLKQIWDSEHMREIRRALVSHDYPDACLNCYAKPKADSGQ